MQCREGQKEMQSKRRWGRPKQSYLDEVKDDTREVEDELFDRNLRRIRYDGKSQKKKNTKEE